MTNDLSTLVFIDLETGGLRPDRHPVIQIAAAAVDEELNELESYEAKVQFAESMATQASLRRHMYSRPRWKREAIPAKEAARGFAAFLRRHATMSCEFKNGSSGQVAQLVAHHAAFDGPFLHAWYNRLGIYCPASRKLLCTMQRAMWHFAERPHLTPPDNYKLQTLCRHLNVTLHPHEAHEAMADVRATVGLYRALIAPANRGQSIGRMARQATP